MKGFVFCKLVLAFSLLSLTSCFSRPMSLPSTKNYILANDSIDREILNLYLWEASKVEALSASVSMKFSKAGFSRDLNISTAFEVPDKLRVEVLPPAIGPPVLLIVSKEGKLDALSRAQRVAYYGEASSENISKFLSLPLKPIEIMRWITGSLAVSLADDIANSAFYTRTSNGQGILEVLLEDGRFFRYLISKDVENPRIDAFELFEGRKKLFVGRYKYNSDSEDLVAEDGQIILPEKAESWLIEEGVKIDTSFKSVKVNPVWKRSTNKKLFRLKVPKSFTKIPVSTYQVDSPFQ